jgi:hypothetical protein
MHKAQRLINHVALVLDGSGSMRSHERSLIDVADAQIRHLALRSEELAQETRVSVYVFDDVVECLIFDMDVMRLPSIKDLYRVRGMTALVDATLKSQDDLATTSQIYGDHAFLTFVLTDGMENASKNPWTTLAKRLDAADVNQSTGFLVPDASSEAYVRRLGVSPGSIARWNATSATGINDAVGSIRAATDSFMTARASGVRGTRNVFSTGTDAVNKATVKSTLSALPSNSYVVLNTGNASHRIDEFVRDSLGNYVRGKAFYQLTKTETIQPTKELVVREKKTGIFYGGSEARHLVGLADGKYARVRPDHNPDYEVYVQSTSVNRKLVPKTKVLVLN